MASAILSYLTLHVTRKETKSLTQSSYSLHPKYPILMQDELLEPRASKEPDTESEEDVWEEVAVPSEQPSLEITLQTRRVKTKSGSRSPACVQDVLLLQQDSPYSI